MSENSKEEKSYKEILLGWFSIIKNEINNITKKQFILSFVFLVLLLCTCIYVVVHKYEDKVYPGVNIYGRDISNISHDKLKERLETYANEISEDDISANIGKNTYLLSMGEIISNYNIDKLYNEIVNMNKDKNIIEKFIAIIRNEKYDYSFDINIDEENIVNCAYIIDKENSKSALEPTVSINGESIDFKNGENGSRLDLNMFIKSISYSLNNKNIYKEDIEIVCKNINEYPDTKIEELEEINHKISSYSTSYASGGGRGQNVELAAKKIDDLLLMPGDEFSYEEALGPIDMKNGYKNAPVIIDGELKDGIGGGVCQVSSTLYNTQLKAGILPTERRNHSKPVNYVPRGLDATLATGSIDYKFKNTLEYPIVINTKTGNNLLTIEFWSNEKALNNIEYKAVGYASGKVANTYLYGYDEDGNKVYEKHIDTSVYR